nr:hypothetical protein CFP56_16612 [Quercus suber]
MHGRPFDVDTLVKLLTRGDFAHGERGHDGHLRLYRAFLTIYQERAEQAGQRWRGGGCTMQSLTDKTEALPSAIPSGFASFPLSCTRSVRFRGSNQVDRSATRTIMNQRGMRSGSDFMEETLVSSPHHHCRISLFCLALVVGSMALSMERRLEACPSSVQHVEQHRLFQPHAVSVRSSTALQDAARQSVEPRRNMNRDCMNWKTKPS